MTHVWLTYEVSSNGPNERLFGKKQVFWSDNALRRSVNEITDGYGPSRLVKETPDLQVWAFERLVVQLVCQRVTLAVDSILPS